MNAPHLGRLENGELDLTTAGNGNAVGDRWRLPLEPMVRSTTQTIDTATVPDDPGVPLQFEAPDVTARFAVAQLEQLNDRIGALTELATEKTDATLERVHNELRRLGSMREVDLTEQAAGIFGAVQAGGAALEQFAAVVAEVTDDLRSILAEALESIGGTEGLAAWVAESASELTDIREEFAASLARIERDLSVMRRRQSPAPSPPTPALVETKLDDDQVTFIVEAVTEAVVSALTTEPRPARRR